MRQVEANLKANLAVEAIVQAAAGMRTNTQSKILYTLQYLQVREAGRAAPTYGFSRIADKDDVLVISQPVKQ